ncbi:MAG: tryptophan synthase alpha chain [Candidatus Binatia bacterium]|nr:MAG: tryptophan synthase alpha chain [Candidatus Binatia bacterium]
MSRIAETFARLAERGEAALVPFLMAGDPSPDRTLALLRTAEASGADLVELGIPFSDPTADGPVLQRSAERALRAGMSVTRVLELVREFRTESSLPVVLFGYYNPIFRYGPERFARDAARAGADGCLVVDLPPEEADELRRWTDRAGLDMIFLLAPTSGPERIRALRRRARGFVYYVSLTGVTGPRPTLPDELEPAVRRVRHELSLPVGVGFGISSPEQAARVSRFADAVVVGSAVMQRVEESLGGGSSTAEVGRFLTELKEAMRKERRE